MDNEVMKDLEYLYRNTEKVNELWSIQETKVKSGNVLKRTVRKLTYWLYRPMFEQQTNFNMYVAAAIADLYRISRNEVPYIEEGRKPSPGMVLPEDGRPRIVQLVSSLNYGDAVGNEVIAFKKIFEDAGYATQIFAGTIHKKIPAGTAYPAGLLPELTKEDIVIYHFSSQCALFGYVRKTKARVILRYHNVTPPKFFHGYDSDAEKAVTAGLKQAARLKDYVDYCLPVSEFNRQDLARMGYRCGMHVIPILIRFQDYGQEPSREVMEKYRDGRKNILYVGRIAPNKKVEDVIASFRYYKEHYDAGARLFLVGSYDEGDRYYRMLKNYILRWGVQDVVFPGHIPFADILAYYRVADVFVCLSEHEGFCVPLVEAMYFKVPIVAYGSCAVPDTMGRRLPVLEDKDPATVAGHINHALSDKKYRERIIRLQSNRAGYFRGGQIAKMLLEDVERFIREGRGASHEELQG